MCTEYQDVMMYSDNFIEHFIYFTSLYFNSELICLIVVE